MTSTKIVPCGTCGVDVEVHTFAANKFVKCPAHRTTQAQKVRGRHDAQDPFEPGLPLEDRQRRIVGAVIDLHREDGAVKWDETITATGLISYDGETGVIHLYAVGGQSLPKFDPRRECGQFVTIEKKEVISVR